MNPELPPNSDPETIEAAAAVWLSLRDRGMSEAETAEFMRWLQLSPKHAEVFGELDAVWRQFNRAGALRPAPVTPPEPDLLVPRPRVRRRAALRPVLAAAAALALAALAWQQWSAVRPTAETAIGAFQKIDLPDGSIVQLNTDSAINVRYSESERRIELLRGEAHFDVAKNPARPFVVAASHVAVRAVGTAFNVRLRPEAVDVLVTEGKVQVNDVAGGASLLPPGPNGGAAPVLGEGERVLVPMADAGRPESADAASVAAPRVAVSEVAAIEIQRALAWQERRLEFEDQSLRDVVAEFNRYNRTKLVIADPALNGRRFSGTFRADAYEPFVRLLEENFGVATTRGPDGIDLRAAK